MTSVGEELPRQMARAAHQVRTLATGIVTPDSWVRANRLLQAVDAAAEAIANQDVVACVQSYTKLQKLGI